MSLTPFIKWAGGKTRQLPYLTSKIPNNINTYYEPFLGGGAMFLWMLEHQKATKYIVSDTNEELIGAYRIIKQDHAMLREVLDQHTQNHSKEYYLHVRNLDETGWVERAARFIYLNKAGFNGLYRVNSKGRFNVPFGEKKTPSFLSDEQFLALYSAFNNKDVTFWHSNWDQAIQEAGEGDFVYLDPPYYPIVNTSFTKYQKNDFVESDHQKIYEFMVSAGERGVRIMQSNSCAQWIIDKYNDDSVFTVDAIDTKRVIQGKGLSSRTKDVIIRNYRL